MRREYVSDLVEKITDLKKVAFAKDGNFVQFPEGTVMLNRLQFGFYSVLARLDVAVDYASVEREFFEEAAMLPTSPNIENQTPQVGA